jgi:hypothetical protein
MWTFYCVLVCWCTTLTTGTRVCGMDESYILPTDFVRTINGVLTVQGSITLVSDSFHMPCRNLLTVVYLDIDGDTIGGQTFANAAKLTTVDASASDIHIVEAYAFYKCQALITILLPDVTDIYNGAFALNVALTTVSWPVLKAAGVASFVGCSNLTTFSAFLLENIGMAAFACCKSLVTLTLPSVITIGIDAFYQCTNMSTVLLPNVVSIGQMAFKSTRLVNVSLPAVEYLGYGAFADNPVLERVHMPVIKSIGGMAFNATDRLHSLVIQNTNAEINPTAFIGSFLSSPACYNWPLYSGFIYSITQCQNSTTSPLLTTTTTTQSYTSWTKFTQTTTATSQTSSAITQTSTPTTKTTTMPLRPQTHVVTPDDDSYLISIDIAVIVVVVIAWILVYGTYHTKSKQKTSASDTYRV